MMKQIAGMVYASLFNVELTGTDGVNQPVH